MSDRPALSYPAQHPPNPPSSGGGCEPSHNKPSDIAGPALLLQCEA